MAILTILIPTYNRANNLNKLLNVLCGELYADSNLIDSINIIIGDNCSDDDTQKVIKKYSKKLNVIKSIRHDKNLGFDRNFYKCVEAVNTKYFILIGDDDLPRSGFLKLIIPVLLKEDPHLVYLPSKWGEWVSNMPDNPLTKLDLVVLDKFNFARRVHVWMTFISGMIVDYDFYKKTSSLEKAQSLFGTNLIQLAWIFNNLNLGNKFIYLDDVCVLATSGNTGGYKVLEVFMVNFTSICRSLIKKTDLADQIITRNLLMYVPSLIWGIRFGHFGEFEKTEKPNRLNQIVQNKLILYLILLPILHLPKFFALPFFYLSLFLSKALRISDAIRERRLQSA